MTTKPKNTPIRALYRKYRPTVLNEVIGQHNITSALSNAISRNHISHAYLFVGPRGTGKTSVARIFAHAINGFDYQVEDDYLDIIEIDAASNTGVDNIRELREKAIIAPSEGQYKVYIIDEVHMLTKSASNALLKTLEEPPEHVVFILATTDAHKIPITISSRAQVFNFQLANPDIMLDHLQNIAEKEKIDIDDDALKIIVRRGGGSFRDSLSILDQVITLSDQKITAEFINKVLGLPQDQIISDLLQSYQAHDLDQLHHLLQDLLNNGLKPDVIASELIDKIINRPDPSFLPLLEKLPDVQPPFPEAKLLLALMSNCATNSPQSPTAPIAEPNPANKPNIKPAASSHTSSPNTKRPLTTDGVEQPTPPPLNTEDNAKTALLEQEAAPTGTSPNAKNNTKTTASQKDKLSESPTPSNSSTEPTSTIGKTTLANFDWQIFLQQIQKQNNAIHSQLKKVDYTLEGTTLHLYPHQKFTKNILEKPRNTELLTNELVDINLIIHDLEDKPPKEPPKDATISQISAIMGTVQEVDAEDSPF